MQTLILLSCTNVVATLCTTRGKQNAKDQMSTGVEYLLKLVSFFLRPQRNAGAQLTFHRRVFVSGRFTMNGLKVRNPGIVIVRSKAFVMNFGGFVFGCIEANFCKYRSHYLPSQRVPGDLPTFHNPTYPTPSSDPPTRNNYTCFLDVYEPHLFLLRKEQCVYSAMYNNSIRRTLHHLHTKRFFAMNEL